MKRVLNWLARLIDPIGPCEKEGCDNEVEGLHGCWADDYGKDLFLCRCCNECANECWLSS